MKKIFDRAFFMYDVSIGFIFAKMAMENDCDAVRFFSLLTASLVMFVLASIAFDGFKSE